jgi:23S rRNA (uracil1939-C5)-methyltransferase
MGSSISRPALCSAPLVARLARLKTAVAPVLGSKREARVTVTGTGQGLDVLMEGVLVSPRALSRLAGEVEALGIARLTVHGEMVALLAESTVVLSGVE